MRLITAQPSQTPRKRIKMACRNQVIDSSTRSILLPPHQPLGLSTKTSSTNQEMSQWLNSKKMVDDNEAGSALVGLPPHLLLLRGHRAVNRRNSIRKIASAWSRALCREVWPTADPRPPARAPTNSELQTSSQATMTPPQPFHTLQALKTQDITHTKT